MDTLLLHGDHSTDGRGLPVTVTGARELIQRALIRLQVPKGAFLPDPSLGSELHRLRRSGSAYNNRIAMSYVQEALAGLPVTVNAVRCTLSDNEDLLVSVDLVAEGDPSILEVTV